MRPNGHQSMSVDALTDCRGGIGSAEDRGERGDRVRSSRQVAVPSREKTLSASQETLCAMSLCNWSLETRVSRNTGLSKHGSLETRVSRNTGLSKHGSLETRVSRNTGLSKHGSLETRARLRVECPKRKTTPAGASAAISVTRCEREIRSAEDRGERGDRVRSSKQVAAPSREKTLSAASETLCTKSLDNLVF